jgi:hypothetical protein
LPSVITAGNVVDMVQSAKDFIKAKGVPAVAQATNRSAGAVLVWKTRNRFPRAAWLELAQAFPELDLETLRKLDSEAPARAA